MKKIHSLALFLVLFLSAGARAQTVDYGNNAGAGAYIMLNGLKHYYEVYGSGKPLLLIHGNSTATKGWSAQIAFFSKKYKVYSVDCRGRGKSELGSDSLTYLQQAKDMTAFINAMKLDSVYVIGKSDGGIIAILMGIYFPERLYKIVSFSANMWPDTTAMYPESVREIHEKRVEADNMLAKKDRSKNWRLEQQKYRLMEFQPHITAELLGRISIPVLVISGDRDLIKEEHTLFIYRHIPKANLCILPNEKHSLPKSNPDLFNNTVDRYFDSGFNGYEFRFKN